MKVTDAMEIFGTKAGLAKALGVQRSAITLWGDDVPELRQYQLEVITNGKLKSDFTKERLRRESEK